MAKRWNLDQDFDDDINNNNVNNEHGDTDNDNVYELTDSHMLFHAHWCLKKMLANFAYGIFKCI